MPSLNTPSTASHSAVSRRTCLAASNQPQNTEDSCTRQFVILTATDGSITVDSSSRQYVKLTATDVAMGWTECTVD